MTQLKLNVTSASLTHRRVLKIALPIVLSNATVPILGAVDVGVVGQLGAAAPIGAVGLGAIILTTIFWMFGFLRMGTVGLVGQAAGSGCDDQATEWLTRALLVAAAGGISIIIMQWPVFWLAFQLVTASKEVETLARNYVSIRVWAAPAAIAIYALTGWLIAMERTGDVFWIQLIMNLLNIFLDFLFVLGMGWGVPGVAIATVIAEVSGAALALWLCRNAFLGPAWRNWASIFNRHKLTKMMVLNLDILLRSAMLVLIFSSFVFIGAQFGDVTLAANQVLLQFIYITAHAMDGFAFAAETLVARAFGGKNPTLVRKSVAMTGIWSFIICVLTAASFAFAGPWIIDLMVKDITVQEAGRGYLWWMVAAPLCGGAAWMLDGVFIGAARGRDMRNMMSISFCIYWIAVLVLTPNMGNAGLWAALLISFVVRGVTLGIRYPALEHSARQG